jgi:Na+-transporting NADH:ubiquinone oxidoreductase subunit NqrB
MIQLQHDLLHIGMKDSLLEDISSIAFYISFQFSNILLITPQNQSPLTLADLIIGKLLTGKPQDVMDTASLFSLIPSDLPIKAILPPIWAYFSMGLVLIKNYKIFYIS